MMWVVTVELEAETAVAKTAAGKTEDNCIVNDSIK